MSRSSRRRCSVLCCSLGVIPCTGRGTDRAAADLRRCRPPPERSGAGRVVLPWPSRQAQRPSIRGWSFSSELKRRSRPGGDLRWIREQPEISCFSTRRRSTVGAGRSFATGWTATTRTGRSPRTACPLSPAAAGALQVRGAGAASRISPGHGPTSSVDRRPFFYQTWYSYLLVALGLVRLAAQLLSQRDQLLKGQMGIMLRGAKPDCERLP